MDLNLFYLLFVAYFVEFASAGGGGKKEKVHVKIHVPELIKHHHHTKIVFIHKKPHHHKKKKPHVVIHKHEHNHKHKHDHDHKHAHKHGHKHDGKHQHKHDHKGHFKHTVEKKHHHDGHKHHGWDDSGHHHGNFYNYKKPVVQINPYALSNEGYHKGVKASKSAHYEIESYDKEPGGDPVSQHVVKGSYQVRERHPGEVEATGFDHKYSYPVNSYGQLNQPNSNGFVPSYPPYSSQQEYQGGDEDYFNNLGNDVGYGPSGQNDFENYDDSGYEDGGGPNYEDYFDKEDTKIHEKAVPRNSTNQ